jgi:hypothetical protein
MWRGEYPRFLENKTRDLPVPTNTQILNPDPFFKAENPACFGQGGLGGFGLPYSLS